MGIFSFLFNSSAESDSPCDDQHQINPGSGLPMTCGIGSLDVAGNAYGFSQDEISESMTHDVCSTFEYHDSSSDFCCDTESFASFDSFDSFDSCSSFDDNW